MHQSGDAWAGREFLHCASNSCRGDALFGEVGQHALHVLIVAAGTVGVLQPARQDSTRRHSNHSVIAALVHQGLVKVKEYEETPVVRGRSLSSAAVLVGLLLSTRRMGWRNTAVEDGVPHHGWEGRTAQMSFTSLTLFARSLQMKRAIQLCQKFKQTKKTPEKTKNIK